MMNNDTERAIITAWFSAQERVQKPGGASAHKHLIEETVGRYVSDDDVAEAAAALGLLGTYPHFNISRRLTLPDVKVFTCIPGAFTQTGYMSAKYFFSNSHGREYRRTSDGRPLEVVWLEYLAAAAARNGGREVRE